MVFPGHISGGYLATRALLAVSSHIFTSRETFVLYAVGIIASELPDLDLFTFFFEHRSDKKAKKSESHRDYISHAPAVWLVIGLIIAGIGGALNYPLIGYAGLVLIAGTWSHFLLDS